MRAITFVLGLLLASVTIAQTMAQALVSVPVRVGEHGGYSRLVLDLPTPTAPGIAREGGRISVRLPENQLADIEAARRRLPAQITALSSSPGELVLTIGPDAQLRHFRLGNRLVVDVLPSGAPAPQAAAEPRAAGTAAAQAPAQHVAAPPRSAPAMAPASAAPSALPLPVPPVPPPPPEFAARQAPATPAGPAAPAATPAAPASATASAPAAPPIPNNLSIEEATPRPPSPAGQAQGPVALAVRPAGDSAITLPFDARTGVALFRRGAHGWIVIDEPRPLDLAPLRGHPRFGGTEITLAAAATVLRVPLEPGVFLRARRDGAVWLVEASSQASAPSAPLRAQVTGAEGARLALPAGSIGRSTALRDPVTGETLLVGTVRDPAFGVAPARGYAAFALPPTAAGVLVVPQSDTVQLRALADAFVVAAGPAGAMGLPIAAGSEASQVAAAGLTRRFDLSAASEAAQAERIRRLAAETGAAAPLARLRLRLETAEALLALGMGAEAHGVLELAAADDPAAARDPRLVGLLAMAALLAGRLAETGGLADPRLDGSDEIALWRALRAIALGQPAEALAPILAATAPLAATYAAPLRRRLVPLVAEGMAAGGEALAAERLLDAVETEAEATQLARARILEARGEVDAALDAYGLVGRGRDRLQRARALSAATELALRSGRIDPAEAAKRLDAALFAWRGDGFELSQRQRIAELRMQAGEPRAALAMLRETASLFPEQEPSIRPQMAAAFATLFNDGAADALPPAQAVTLFEENIDLLPPGPAGETMIGRLSERLLQLDLPGRAAALVARVMEAQAEGDARAALGARLAMMRLADKDPLGARAALAASATDGLPPSLVRERRGIEARALAESGDPAGALAILGEQSDPPALELRAAIAAAAGDWPAAVPPLAALVAATLPAPGAPLDPAQRRTLLRLATAAALAGQTELLSRLARERGEAMREGPLSEPFRLLTADPVRGAADLPRMAAELRLARGLPQSLAAIGTATPPPARR
jgi:hypothetical protein